MAFNDFGTVRPGSTLYVPFHTFADAASITITGLATTDIDIYKNGSTTERASTTGYTLLDTDGIDFDGATGIHGFSIALSSNATSGFYTAGARYWVVVNAITVDGETIRFVAATFRIGYADALVNTTIATLSSQTSFTLASGEASGDNNTYIGCPVVIHDVASAVQMAIGVISAYTGSSRTVTLAADPGIFTMAAGDNISIFLPSNVRFWQGTTANATQLLSDAVAIESEVIVVHSETTVVQSDTAVIETVTSDIQSDTNVLVPAVSDIESSLVIVKSDLVVVESDTTHIESDATAIESELIVVHSETTVVQSDTTVIESDTTVIESDVVVIQGQIDGIGAGTGAALNFANEADNVDSAIKSISFDGVETSGTNASVNFEDGTYHQIDDTANNIDIVYQFDVGGGRTATELTWKGRLIGLNDEFTIQAYNGTGWDTLKTISGQSNSAPSTSTDNATESISLLSTHTGTGSDLGKVFIRLECASQSNPTLYTDQLLVAAVSTGQSVGYANGMIWIDAVNGTAGTESFVNGTADNPVDNLADALTLSSAVGLQSFHIATGSSITLTASATNYLLTGSGWTLAFGGQAITAAYIIGATVSGTFTGGTAIFEDCIINAITGPGVTMRRCFFNEVTMTNNGTDGWFLNGCRSRVAGTGAPNFDFGSGVGASDLNLRAYSGGIELENCDTGDSASIEGDGNVIINANSNGGTVVIRGNMTLTDNGTSMTINDDARIDVAQINAEVDAAIVDADLDHVYSDTTAIHSDTTIIASDVVQVYSDTTHIDSDVTALESAVSDVESSLVIAKSDIVQIYSDTTVIASDVVQVYSDTTHIDSDIIVVGSDVLQVYSDTTIIASDLVIAASDVVQIYSDTTVIASDTALWETAEAEPGAGAPASNATPLQKNAYMYKWQRNKFDVTASDISYYADDESTVDQKVSHSDDGTVYERGEISAGT